MPGPRTYGGYTTRLSIDARNGIEVLEGFISFFESELPELREDLNRVISEHGSTEAEQAEAKIDVLVRQVGALMARPKG